MDKENLVSNNVVFLINNKEESECVQNYLFSLGFKWYPATVGLSEVIHFDTAHGKNCRLSKFEGKYCRHKYPVLIFVGFILTKNNKQKYYISYTTTSYMYNEQEKIKLIKASNLLRKNKLYSIKHGQGKFS